MVESPPESARRLLPVLVRPLYAGNAGSAVRLGANLAFDTIAFVDPQFPVGDPDFVRMAMGGEDRIVVSTFDTIDEAVAGCDLVLATTSLRERDPRSVFPLAEVRDRVARSASRRIAVLFGPERSGLTHDDLRRCHMLLTVPANPAFPTLNLVQAMAIVLYSLGAPEFSTPMPEDPMDAPADLAEFREALSHIERELRQTGFLDPANPARVMDKLQLWFGRSTPTRRELAILRGIAAHVGFLASRSGGAA